MLSAAAGFLASEGAPFRALRDVFVVPGMNRAPEKRYHNDIITQNRIAIALLKFDKKWMFARRTKKYIHGF